MGRVSIIETNLIFANELATRPYTQWLVLHHVGSPDMDASASDIHQWHLANGWSGCGYSYVIRKSGDVERGRPRYATGSHCYGYNSYSIGINVAGDFNATVPTEEQRSSLVNLLSDLCEIYDLDPDVAIVGHRDKSNTECPGNNLYSMLPSIKEAVKEVISSD